MRRTLSFLILFSSSSVPLGASPSLGSGTLRSFFLPLPLPSNAPLALALPLPFLRPPSPASSPLSRGGSSWLESSESAMNSALLNPPLGARARCFLTPPAFDVELAVLSRFLPLPLTVDGAGEPEPEPDALGESASTPSSLDSGDGSRRRFSGGSGEAGGDEEPSEGESSESSSHRSTSPRSSAPAPTRPPRTSSDVMKICRGGTLVSDERARQCVGRDETHSEVALRGPVVLVLRRGLIVLALVARVLLLLGRLDLLGGRRRVIVVVVVAASGLRARWGGESAPACAGWVGRERDGRT